MASLIDLRSTNWSYHSIPVAFLLCMVPHLYGMLMAGKNYDLGNPRKTEENCTKDTSMKKMTLARISRARAATANGIETLPLFAASIVAGNAAGVAVQRMNALALVYLLSRAAYNYVYVVLQDNARFAMLRVIAWWIGVVEVLWGFVLAGRVVNK